MKKKAHLKILNLESRTDNIIAELFQVWKKSVKATHLFLSDSEIDKIAEYVPNAIKKIPTLIIATNHDKHIAFMGIDKQKLEMLFVTPDLQGQGIGKQLLQHAINLFNVTHVCVNEQNPKASGFYESMGFNVYERSDTDEQGNPYPILYMKLS